MSETECANKDKKEWSEMSKEEKRETCRMCGFECDYAKKKGLLTEEATTL
jgi:hypothetical protein